MPKTTPGTIGDSHGFEDCHNWGQSEEIKRAHLDHANKMFPVLCELTVPNVCECCGIEGSSIKALKVCTGELLLCRVGGDINICFLALVCAHHMYIIYIRAPSDFVSFVPLMIAIGCRRVKYCGRKCQKLDWKAHKAVCQAQSFLGREGEKEELMDVKHMMTWYVLCQYLYPNHIPIALTILTRTI